MNQRLFKTGIQLVNLKKMIIPAVFLCVLAVLALRIPVLNCLFPASFSTGQDSADLYKNNIHYINCTIDKLYYTGFDYTQSSRVKGHYYYTLEDGRCDIFLLSSDFVNNAGSTATDTSENASVEDPSRASGSVPAILENVTFNARFISHKGTMEALLKLLARDLGWTYQGISACTQPLIISQYHYSIVPSVILGILLAIAFAGTILHMIVLACNIISPYQATTFYNLKGRLFRRHALTATALELEKDLHFRRENMYVTNNYYVYKGSWHMAVIPLETMAWAYIRPKWIPFWPWKSRPYIITIVTKKKLKFRYYWKTEDTANIFLTYLRQNNPNMLIGKQSRKKI